MSTPPAPPAVVFRDFTANSMNCLNEASASPFRQRHHRRHARRRKELFLQRPHHRRSGRATTSRRPHASARHRHLPGIRECHDLDISMALHQTVLHLLAAAQRPRSLHHGGHRPLSRRVPNSASRALAPNVHLEDVHRAGGIMAILGELDRAACSIAMSHRYAPRSASPSTISTSSSTSPRCAEFYRARPSESAPRSPSASRPLPRARLDRDAGVIRNLAHAFSKDGGLAVLYGNIAEEGCIVKTAGVDAAISLHRPARIFESQTPPSRPFWETRSFPAMSSSSATKARGGPACRDALPHQLPQVQGSRQSCALITDGASPAAVRLCIAHLTRGGEAAPSPGRRGRHIEIDIPSAS